MSWLFGHVYLIKRIRLFSKFMTSQPGQQNIAIHILTNISRSTDNQAMKFAQLTEYNTRNISLEKLYIKCCGVLKFVFIVRQVEGLTKLITKLQTTCFYLIWSFLKKQIGLELVFLPHFLHDFEEKYSSCYILLPEQFSLSGCIYFIRFGQYLYCTCLLTGLWRYKFWN